MKRKIVGLICEALFWAAWWLDARYLSSTTRQVRSASKKTPSGSIEFVETVLTSVWPGGVEGDFIFEVNEEYVAVEFKYTQQTGELVLADSTLDLESFYSELMAEAQEIYNYRINTDSVAN